MKGNIIWNCGIGIYLLCGGTILGKTPSNEYREEVIQEAVEKSLLISRERQLTQMATAIAKDAEERKQALEVLRSRLEGDSFPKNQGVQIVSYYPAEKQDLLRVCALIQYPLGWMPAFFMCQQANGQLVAKPEKECNFTKRLDPIADGAITRLRQIIAKWKSIEDDELESKVETWKNDICAQIAALEMADREGLPIVSGYGPVEKFRQVIASVEGLSPAEVRVKIIAEIESQLSALEGK